MHCLHAFSIFKTWSTLLYSAQFRVNKPNESTVLVALTTTNLSQSDQSYGNLGLAYALQ